MTLNMKNRHHTIKSTTLIQNDNSVIIIEILLSNNRIVYIYAKKKLCMEGNAKFIYKNDFYPMIKPMIHSYQAYPTNTISSSSSGTDGYY